MEMKMKMVIIMKMEMNKTIVKNLKIKIIK